MPSDVSFIVSHITDEVNSLEIETISSTAIEADDDTLLLNNVKRKKLLGYDEATAQVPVEFVLITESVTKWIDRADGRYREIFSQRMVQLAAGERSYTLSKGLKGCENPIFETKLDDGQRILWSRVLRGDVPIILVWCVSKHDSVSRKLRLIDQSFTKLAWEVKHGVIAGLEEGSSGEAAILLEDDDSAVLIDPFKNTPLKLVRSCMSRHVGFM